MRKYINWKSAARFLLAAAMMGLWLHVCSAHELYNKNGECYNQFSGLYFLCAALGLGAMADNFLHPRPLTRGERLGLGAFGVFFALASVMANYSLFDFTQARGWLNLGYSLTGGFLVGYQCLLWGLRRLPFSGGKGERNRAVWVFFGTFAALAGMYLLYFFCVAFPGYFSRDSFSAVWQCFSGVYDNTSPFFHTMVVKLCLELGAWLGYEGGSAVWVYGFFQCIAMAAVFAYALVTLYQAGMPKWVLGVILALDGLLRYHLAYSATLWKDVPFSLGALAVAVSLYRILKNIGNSRGNYLVFTVSGLVFSLMRTNGWYAFLVTALVLLVLGRKQWRLLTLCAAVVATGWLCNHPLLDWLGVEETNFVEALGIPFQQVSRVVAQGYELEEEDEAFLEQLFDLELVEQLYDPLTVDPIKFEAFQADNREYLQNHMGQFVRVWLRLGAQHPWEYAKAWIDQTQGYWNAGYNFWIYPQGGESPELGITREPLDNPVKDGFDWLFHFQQSTPLLTQPLYGIGFQVWILVFVFALLAIQGRREWILTVPALVVVVGLWLGTPVFAEFRYAYPVFVTVPLLLPLAAFRGREKE